MEPCLLSFDSHLERMADTSDKFARISEHYSHKEREQKVTDHSLMVVDVEVRTEE